MRTPRLFFDGRLEPQRSPGTSVRVEADAAHYLTRVLRLRPHDPVTLFTGQGGEYAARVQSLDRQRVHLTIEGFADKERESLLRISLAQVVSRGERMDHTLEKAVELGASAIYPLRSARCGVDLSGSRLERRLAHWQGVLRSACAQCGRNRVPQLHPLQALSALVDEPQPGLKVLLDPAASASLRDVSPPTDGSVLLLCGPEGGLEAEEIAAAASAGFQRVRLGPRVLRTETAPLAAIAALQTLWGDLG